MKEFFIYLFLKEKMKDLLFFWISNYPAMGCWWFWESSFLLKEFI